jgi:hypothetical protein
MLQPAVIERRRMEARIHGHVLAARRVRHYSVVLRSVHHPRPLRDVPERRPGGGHHRVRQAQQVNLRPRLRVVRLGAEVHAPSLTGGCRLLPVHALQFLGVPELEGGDEDGCGFSISARCRCDRICHGEQLWEQPMFLRALSDLFQERWRIRLRTEDAHLDSHPPLRHREVSVVVPRDEAPYVVARVEQVPSEVMEYRILLRE